MHPESQGNNGRSYKEELRKAEVTAAQFLEQNGPQISEALRTKARYLESLIQLVGHRETPLDQRLDCFARIAEISALLKEDADGFFDLASQPLVARILLSGQKR
jgi:hypothetical protein